MKAIIIDDTEQARITLKQDLKHYAPQINVIDEAEGVVSGAKLLKLKTPDILFLDIQMQDGSGFDLLDILPKINFNVIFITASDAHAIKAFKYAAIDYLLKPIDPDELKAAIEKCSDAAINEKDKYNLLSESIKNGEKPNQKIALHSQDRIQIVDIASIIRCESSVNYTTFFFQDKSQIVVTKTLKEYTDLLTEQGFFRVHQSHLINTKHINEYVKTDGGHLIMTDKSLIPVSVRKRPEVIKMLSHL